MQFNIEELAESIGNIVPALVNQKLDALVEHLADELEVDAKKIRTAISEFKWEVEGLPKLEKTKSKASGSTKSSSKSPKEKSVEDLKKAIKTAIAEEKYLNVENNRKCGCTPQSKKKYIFDKKYGICALTREKLNEVIKRLDNDEDSDDEVEKKETTKKEDKKKVETKSKKVDDTKKKETKKEESKKEDKKKVEDKKKSKIQVEQNQFDQYELKIDGKFSKYIVNPKTEKVFAKKQDEDEEELIPLKDSDFKFLKSKGISFYEDIDQSKLDEDILELTNYKFEKNSGFDLD